MHLVARLSSKRPSNISASYIAAESTLFSDDCDAAENSWIFKCEACRSYVIRSENTQCKAPRTIYAFDKYSWHEAKKTLKTRVSSHSHAQIKAYQKSSQRSRQFEISFRNHKQILEYVQQFEVRPRSLLSGRLVKTCVGSSSTFEHRGPVDTGYGYDYGYGYGGVNKTKQPWLTLPSTFSSAICQILLLRDAVKRSVTLIACVTCTLHRC